MLEHFLVAIFVSVELTGSLCKRPLNAGLGKVYRLPDWGLFGQYNVNPDDQNVFFKLLEC